MGFFLRSKLRKASNTEIIEKKRDELRKDFEEYQAFFKSEELEHFKKLEAYVLSAEFARNRKTIEKKKVN